MLKQNKGFNDVNNLNNCAKVSFKKVHSKPTSLDSKNSMKLLNFEEFQSYDDLVKIQLVFKVINN